MTNSQLESDDDEIDTLQQRIEWWMLVVDNVGPIYNNVYDYTFDELYVLYRKAIDPEKRDLINQPRIYRLSHKNKVEKLIV